MIGSVISNKTGDRLVIGTGSEYNTKSDWGGVGLIILKSLGGEWV